MQRGKNESIFDATGMLRPLGVGRKIFTVPASSAASERWSL